MTRSWAHLFHAKSVGFSPQKKASAKVFASHGALPNRKPTELKRLTRLQSPSPNSRRNTADAGKDKP
jgi:hypothetical protein